MAKDRGIWLMTDECYTLSTKARGTRWLPGAKDTVLVAGSSETCAMTELAHRFRAGSGAGEQDQEAAEPLDVESDLVRAEGALSVARTSGISRSDAGRTATAT
jgi:hypothetical protein